LGDDDRRCLLGSDGRDQCVQAADAAVSEARTLFTRPKHLDDRVVDVHHDPPVDPVDHRSSVGEAGQESGGDGVELADVPEGEGAQERSHGGRRRAWRDLAHGAVPQQHQVIDAVRTSHHTRDQ
jgi:hypothetical protein